MPRHNPSFYGVSKWMETKTNQPTMDIRRSDRLSIVGTTGSGKSTLAAFLLVRRNHTVILDPKHSWEFPKGITPKHGIPITTTLPDVVVRHETPNTIIYRPEQSEIRSGLTWFWEWVWWRENTLVYVDELFLVKRNTQELYLGHEKCIMQGRQKNISVWHAFQRPSRVPIPPLSESEHVFVFRLRHPDDIKRMAQYTDKQIETNPAAGHDFWYYGDRDQTLFKSNAKRLNIRDKK